VSTSPPPGPGQYPPPPPQGGWQQPGQYPPPPPSGGWQQGGYPTPPPVGDWQQQGVGGQLAGWWQRVGATIVDGLILAVPSFILGFATRSSYAGFGLAVVLHVLYITIMLAQRGQTVGNMAVGTRVVDATTGGPVTFGKALGRSVATVLFDEVIYIIGLFNVLWPLWDRQNQTLHDKIAGTVVLRR